MIDLNQYISKRHQTMVEKFNKDLEAFAQETEEAEPTLYEDAFTSFTLSNVRLENGQLCYRYDGKEDHDQIVLADEESEEFFEDTCYGIADTISFWRSCLRRAKKYWSMDIDRLDAIQNGDMEEEED